ncbi:MAG TPA: alpha/beta fold hydrolase [Patescibacteria group bacterium]|nr:alpha/beta fold hydrolase [Patescibacteria group bacterium]
MKTLDWLDTREYPFKNNSIIIGGHTLQYIDEGMGDILLFIHGTPSWSFEFRNLIKAFSKTHRCIAPDHFGFGLSDKPTGYDYSVQHHAQVLKEFIEKLNLKNITLVVHDFGGLIGLNYAVENPGNIERLIIMNTWMWSSRAEPEFKKLEKVLRSPLLPFLYRYLSFSVNVLLPKSFADRKKLTPHLHNQYKKPFLKTTDRLGTLGLAHSLLQAQDWFEQLWQRRAAIGDKPVLLIWGMKDSFVTPKYLTKFENAFKNSETLQLENAGHFPHEEEPDAVIAEIRRWL